MTFDVDIWLRSSRTHMVRILFFLKRTYVFLHSFPL